MNWPIQCVNPQNGPISLLFYYPSLETQNQSLLWLQQFQDSKETWDLCLKCLLATDLSNTKAVFGILKLIQQKLKNQWILAVCVSFLSGKP